MNKARRERVRSAIAALETVKETINDILMEEEMMLDNIPENLQGSQRYEDMESAIDYMNDAVLEIESAIDNLEEV